MEITSLLSMWNHSVLRTSWRADSCSGWLLCSRRQRSREVIVLLGPEQSSQRLAVHPALIFVHRVGRRNPVVEFVSVGDAAFERFLETTESIFYLGGRQTQPNRLAAAGGHL